MEETEELKVWLKKPNHNHQWMAIAKIGDRHANNLLSLQHLKVG